MANEDVLNYVQAHRASFKAVAMVSASPAFFGQMAGDVFGCIDFCAGNKTGLTLRASENSTTSSRGMIAFAILETPELTRPSFRPLRSTIGYEDSLLNKGPAMD
jgi:hypothetical protein